MNARDLHLSKKLLDVLHEHSPRPVEQTALFGELHAVTNCSKEEFEAVLELVDAQGWLTGVKGKYAGALWAINDEGEVARLQIKP